MIRTSRLQPAQASTGDVRESDRSQRIIVAICWAAFIACLVLLATTGPLKAQQATGEIVGTVTDGTNAAIPGAKVVVRSLDTDQTKELTTGGSGDYTFSALNPGNYQVSITAPSFKAFKIDNIRLAAGDHYRANAQMQAGAVSEVVSVSSNASSLQTESSAVDTTLTERAVQDLPLNGRNFINLVLLVPGASEGTPDGPASGGLPVDRRQSSQIAVNGQSGSTNDHLVDGVDNIERFAGVIGVRPSIDAISEVQVQTNTFTADVGRTGGGVINVVTKAGTNKLHGSVYEFFRNDKFDAYPFAFGAHLPKAELRQNQFGGSLGGPIRKDKLFFFADYEELRKVAGIAPVSYTVPTLYEQQHPGDFSDTGGIVVPAASLDKAGLAYLSLLPNPNNGLSTFTGGGNNILNTRTYDGRADYQIDPSNLVFTRYTYNRVYNVTPASFPSKVVNGITVIPDNPGQGPATDNAQNAVLGYQRVVTPHLLLDVKAAYLYINNVSQAFNVGVNPNAAFGQAGINLDLSTSALAYVTISAAGTRIGTGGLGLPLQEKDNAYQLVGSATYTRGANTLKFGGAAIRRDVYQIGQSQGEGRFVFASFTTLAQGKPNSVSRNYSLVGSNFRTFETSAYAQDDWHIRRNLTLNLGLRYDVFTPYTERSNHISNFDPVNGKIILANTNGTNAYGGLHNDFSNLAPRIGFSYTPFANTVVHGGFGTVYYPALVANQGVLRSLPYTFVSTACSEAANACPTGFNTFSAGLPTPVAGDPNNPVGGLTSVVDPNFKNTSVAQYNLYVQQAFGPNVFSIGYVGLSTRHVLAVLPDINGAIPNTCGAVASCYNALRPYFTKLPNVTSISQLTSSASSNYNALQASFDRRASTGLTLGGTYTWAHDIDDSGTPGNGTKTDGFASLASQFRSLDRGNSNYDARNRISARVNYVLPFGSTLTGIKGLLAKGWQTNLIYIWSTGITFTVVNSTSVSNTNATGVDRPNQISNQLTVPNPTISKYFNTAAFQVQQAGTLGQPLGYVTSATNPTIGPLYERRDQLYGPHFRHLDLSFFKTFPIFEKAHLEFRAEAFNITNTTSFVLPNAVLQAANFGTITGTNPQYTPRQIQLALKLNF